MKTDAFLVHSVSDKVKVISLINYHVKKTYGGVEVQLQAFLTSAPSGGKWSASRPGRFIQGDKPPDRHWIGG
jgi:hypothetical protein